MEPGDVEPFTQGSDTLVEIDGQACAVGRDAIWCLDFGAPPAVDVPVPIWRTAEQVVGEIRVTPYLEQLGEGSGFAPEDQQLAFELRDVSNTDAGETFVIVGAQFLNEGIDHVNVSWVARYDSVAGTFERFAGPSVGTALTNLSVLPSVLGEATTIDYDPVWDALWVGPVYGWQPSGTVIPNTVRQEQSFVSGQGFRILPLEEEGASGYLDLSNAWHRAHYCELEATCFIDGYNRPKVLGSDICFPGDWYQNYDRQLVFDRDLVDLDADTLMAAEEAALGTSDVRHDTDGDGSPDGFEALLGTDPLDGAAPDTALHVWATSGVLYDVDDRFATLGDSYALDGPACAEGHCRDLAGRILASWESDGSTLATVAVDGRHALLVDRDGLRVVDIQADAVRPLATAAQIHPAVADVITGGSDSNYLQLQSWLPVSRPGVLERAQPSRVHAPGTRTRTRDARTTEPATPDRRFRGWAGLWVWRDGTQRTAVDRGSRLAGSPATPC